jgi:hypothetical protein
MNLKPEIRSILIFAGVAVVVLATIPFAWMYAMSSIWTSGDSPHPSDAEMLAKFQSHKATFSQLVEMAQEDRNKFHTVGDLCSPNYLSNNGLSQTRIEMYQTACRKLGLPTGVTIHEDTGIIEFTVSTQGLAVSGSSKSYVYRRIPPGNIVPDIETYRNDPQINSGYPVFRHIEGNWYLSFEAN